MWSGKTVNAEHVEFATRAAKYFSEHPDKHTFTDGPVAPGELLAIKWAFDSDQGAIYSVAVVRISTAVLVEHP